MVWLANAQVIKKNLVEFVVVVLAGVHQHLTQRDRSVRMRALDVEKAAHLMRDGGPTGIWQGLGVEHHENGVPTVSVRPFNIFGPGQVGEGAVHAFVLRALRTSGGRVRRLLPMPLGPTTSTGASGRSPSIACP